MLHFRVITAGIGKVVFSEQLTRPLPKRNTDRFFHPQELLASFRCQDDAVDMDISMETDRY